MPVFVRSAVMWRHVLCASIACMPALWHQSRAETAIFAHSRHHNVEIDFADSSSQCSAGTLHLLMQITPQSQDIDTPESQIHLANALGGKLSGNNQCADVSTVNISVLKNGSEIRQLQALRSTGWQFTEVVPTSAQISAPALQPSLSNDASPEVTTSATAPAVIIPEGYMGFLAQIVRKNASLLDNDAVQACWAQHYLRHDFFAAQGNEFRVHEIDARAKSDLAQLSSQIKPDVIRVELNLRLGEYDFSRSDFPVELNGDLLSVSSDCNLSPAHLPGRVTLHLPDKQQIFRIPMSAANAEQFLKQRTRFGYINRDVFVSLSLHVNEAVMSRLNDETYDPVPAELNQVQIFSGPEKKTLLADISENALTAIRKEQLAEKAVAVAREEAAKRAENLRQMQLQLQNASYSQRLAMWVGQNNRNFGLPDLSTIRLVRQRAAVSGKPVDAILLVHTDGSGRDKVETQWPGKLNLTIAKNQPSFTSNTWYVVQGQVSVPGGDFPSAEMTVQAEHVCKEEQCKDAGNLQALEAALKAQNVP